MTYLDKDFHTSFDDLFKGFTLEYESLEYIGQIPVFFIQSVNDEQLTMHWSKIVDFIAFEFQSKLTEEFSVWNIYLFFIKPLYIADGGVYSRVKLQIENDTFSSRKIVVDNDDHEKIINEHIINKNIDFNLETTSTITKSFEPNILLWGLQKGKVLKKQKITQETHSVFDNLVTELKNIRQ
ncbi:ABC-three component system middle component 1 [Dyadobacter sp. LHD-138]|uniref:ABC-three component system middle component 1 n=1 Tax=Dyadobacter sp. LHD-138 TaxID=3071413 RepID=UPI0027DEE717|nr:ABC-three component system middle component 1 [Dyadobacter sp. LHD-138]MDQ6481833.1 hypothetical protein [Dyadobacter sp. LHD-138]